MMKKRKIRKQRALEGEEEEVEAEEAEGGGTCRQK